MDYDIASHSDQRIFEKLFLSILFNLRVFVRNLAEEIIKEIFFHISFCSRRLTLDLKCDLTSNKPTYHLLDYGDS